MPFDGFTDSDYDVFEIPLFADRMAAIRSRIRPKLLDLGEEMADRMRPVFGPDFYPHVASHMRRRVNPPPDTWVAFGPSKKGYKAYPHLSIGIGHGGPYVEFIVMEESEQKSVIAEGLKRNASALSDYLHGLDGISLRLDHHAPSPGLPASVVTPEELGRIAGEVVRLKRNEFMIARPFDRDDPLVAGRELLPTAARLFEALHPFYRCALEPDYTFERP
ncbi:MAG: DUF1054 domain-containing protein [Armatimonadetes bacterium]|nr:DUF1054 domain-containing protein [Armatimonadota bacterium]